jgi:transcriptional regulator with XRE-family HTH domain
MIMRHANKNDDPSDKNNLTSLANRVDHQVGLCIKTKRQQRGVTQQELAQALGISYQQVQKYENGTNRITAGRLYILARALGLEVAEFFSSIDQSTSHQALPITSEDVVLTAKEINALRDPRVRNSIRSLVRILSTEPHGPR